MLVRLRGWNDEDVLALLTLFRKHLLYYVYASDSQFAEVMRAELPDKAASEILEMVRALMDQFGLTLSTKNFRTDVIVMNGHKMFVYEHIYESIRQLPENRAGGVWLPDELSRFLQKAKQYRDRFSDNQEKYFKRVQVWGKSIAETKSKFYALRELFMREKHRMRQRKGIGVKRLELLKDIFTDVPPSSRADTVPVLPSKAPKLWSSQEMEALVDFVVRITTQIQKTGSSDLVDGVAIALRRTDGSCVNKLADMREKFLKKATMIRAANLPDTIYDPSSEAHKIFSADWNDRNDPYALGYLALKSRSLRLNSERHKKRRAKSIWSPRPKLRSSTMAARGTPSGDTSADHPSVSSAAVLSTTKPVGRQSRNNKTSAAQQSHRSGRSASALPANDYASFVRDIAERYQWTEKVVHHVLRCMQHSIGLYRSNKLVDFFSKIASLTPDVTFHDLFANAQHILIQYKQRFGTLEDFEDLDLTASGTNSPIATSDHETKEQDHIPDNEVKDASVAADTQGKAAEENATVARSSEERIADGGNCGQDQSPVVEPPVQQTSQSNSGNADVGEDNHDGDAEAKPDGEQSPFPESPAQTPQTGNEDAALDDEHEHEQSPLPDSPLQTPQTGNEDGADEHSSSTTEKQSSPGLLTRSCDYILPSTYVTLMGPADTWDDGADGDADLDDDDNQSVGSSDNAWSGSSNFSDTKNTHHHSKDNCPLNNLLPGQHASKKPFKRGKDEQYGKNFNLAKKRRLDEKPSTTTKDDDDDEDEGYDEGDDEDESEDAGDEPSADVDSLSSDGELEETPHALQSILDSLNSHMVELQEKQRVLIEQKEDRQWRQHQYADRQYGQTNVQSFSSQW
ncbi:hypothetical protein, variant 1 [Phytophthora nicotianae]|uniref:Uncharacterized protein n=3 Tax=Phytophthora nicotianae TaxID=4792 RepID=V9EHW3_PHYNI|nr:hypothetical protein, variant 1 [Phytophthora nicotianae P1569]ETL84565.1 hypothetical protein, variant 1 [Phytophthora nicotianae]ETO66441.1 hypothetical protein, variant 1 [Phytophthora nicotianae P1976]